jgi:hypothetical protein
MNWTPDAEGVRTPQSFDVYNNMMFHDGVKGARVFFQENFLWRKGKRSRRVVKMLAFKCAVVLKLGIQLRFIFLPPHLSVLPLAELCVHQVLLVQPGSGKKKPPPGGGGSQFSLAWFGIRNPRTRRHPEG